MTLSGEKIDIWLTCNKHYDFNNFFFAATFYKPKVELSLPWTGINLIMENLGSFDDGMAAARECNDSPHQQTNTSVQGGSSDSSEGFVLKYNLNQHVGNSQGSESVEQSANSLGRRNLFFENIMPRKRKMLHVCRADRQSCIINSKTKQLGSSFHECFDEDLESITSIQDEFDLVNRESQSLLSQYSTVSQMTADQHTHTDTDQNETENDMHSSTKHFEHQKPSAITELPKALLKRNLKLETFCEMKNEKYDILATVLQVSNDLFNFCHDHLPGTPPRHLHIRILSPQAFACQFFLGPWDI